MKLRTNKLIGVLVVVALLGLLVGCSGNKQAEEEAKEETKQAAIPVETVTAQTGQLASYTTVVGQAEPIKTVQVTPELQGKVETVKVEVGDHVAAGDKLVQLDKEDLQVQVDQARANLQVAKSNLNKILAGTREEKLAQLKAQIEQAKANYERAENNYQRQKRLFEKEIISEQQLEASKSQYIAAKSSYQSAKESLKLAQEGATKEEIETIKAQVEQAEVGLRSAKLRLDKADITAPMAGVVSQVNIEEGEVAARQPVVSLVNMEQMKIMTYVSERYVNKLNPAERVQVTFSALNKTYDGWINTISPVADPRKGKFLTKIIVDNPGRTIKAGMYGEVKFKTAISQNQIVLPRAAVLNAANEDYVYLVEDGKAVYKQVTTGLTSEQRIVVKQGLEPGDKVIVTGNEQVSGQDKVKVVDRGDQ